MKSEFLSSAEIQNFGGEYSQYNTYLEKFNEFLCLSVISYVLLLPSGFY